MSKKKMFYKKVLNNPIVDIDYKNKKGWRIGSLTLLVPKDYKNPNRLRNFLISENKLKHLVFDIKKKK
jgi:ribosomal protein S18